MKKILIFIFLIPLFVQGQIIGYHVAPVTTTITPYIFNGGWSVPAEWTDSLGAIDILDAGHTLAANTIRILVNTRTELSTFDFSVTCINGYKVCWNKHANTPTINYATSITATKTYDTTKCQKFVIIEITPQAANNITLFNVQPSSLALQVQYPSYLWIAVNYTGASPIMYYTTIICNKLQAVWMASCTSLSGNSFANCSSLQSVTIPFTVTSTGGSSMESTALRSITIPSSVTSIGDYTFRYCYFLQSITITGTGLLTIGSGMFNTDYSLKSVVIPSSVTAIGINMFYLNYNLKKVTYDGTITTAVDNSAFMASCEQLDTVKMTGLKTTRFNFYGVPGKLNKLGAAGNLVNDSIPLRIDWANSTFASTSSPQLNLSYNSLTTAQIVSIFYLLPTATKTITVVGCTGAAGLTAPQIAIATNKGWTVLN